LFRFSPEFFFDVVLNVNEYNEFVPFCVGSNITKSSSTNKGTMYADLIVGFKHFTESYTSSIHYERPKSIQIKALKSSVFGNI
jgi:coenzyme Q-binding protein COQ10